jgi:hypothetical protein
MAHPIIIQDSSFRNYLANFRDVIRPAQWRYFETVLMGFMHCQASRTLSGMLRTLAVLVRVWQLSRFLVSPRWSTLKLAEARSPCFCTDLEPLVAAAHEQQRVTRPKKRGRTKATVVTGYLIFDDSTHVKRYAQAMGGIIPAQTSAPCRGTVCFRVSTWWKGTNIRWNPRCTSRKRSANKKACLSGAR